MRARARWGACVLELAVLLAAPALAPAAPRDEIADAVIGQPDFATPPDGTISASRFVGAAAVAEDPRTGEFWVSDTDVNRVLRFASARAYANGEAANLVLGQPDFASSGANRGGAPAADTMNFPSGLAVDRLGRLYVVDSENQRVLVFAPPFANGMGAAFVLGQPDFESAAPNRGQAAPTAVSLNIPRGVAVDAEGNAWVADTGNARVLRYTVPSAAHGATRAGLRAQRVLGQPGFTTSATALTPTGMNFPVALSFDPAGNLWVADQFASRITRFDAASLNVDGSAATGVLCAPDLASPSNGLRANGCSFPTGVAVDPAGRVYVADSGYHRVLRFDDPRNGADASAVFGQPDFVSAQCNRGLADPTAATLCVPLSLAVDRRGNLHVSDFGYGRVLRFDEPRDLQAPLPVAASPRQIARGGPAGLRLTVTGTRFHDHTVVHWNGEARPTTYLGPDRLVATLEAGDYATAGNHTVTVVTAGTAPAGELAVEVYDRAPRDGAADRFLGKAEFAHPDERRAVGEVRHGGASAADFGDVSPPVAIDPASGRLFAVDWRRNRILSWPSAAEFGNAQSADIVIGQRDFHANACNTTGLSARSLCAPGGATVDGAGRLYVADAGNHRVLRFDPPFATGMAAAAVYGQGGSFTEQRQNAGGLGRAGLSFPDAVAVHGNRLFVFDGQNRRVLAYDAGASDDDLADLVIGQPDFTSAQASTPGPARFVSAGGGFLAFDAAGNLFVSDPDGHRVLRFSAPFTNGMAADLVIGQPEFTRTARAQPPTATGLNLPQGIAFDPTGQLLVADSGSSRVTVYRPPFANGMAAREALGGTLTAEGPVGGAGAVPLPAGLAVDAAGNVVAGIGTPAGGAIVAFDQPLAPWAAPRLVNLSTRAAVQAGDNVLIGGFIIGGTGPKTVVVRARGPSLAAFGVAGVLANPLLQLFRADGTQAAVNDNWQQAANAAAIQASGFAPAHEFESAVRVTLDPGAYTAIVSGAGGVTGVGIVEVFEVDGPAVPLANISTRGRVLTGENVMIAGFVIQGDEPRQVVVRARGPSLAPFGVPGVLANPLLQLFSGDGTPLLANDDWQQAANAQALAASGFAPADAREAAILVTLNPGAYTAIVTGAGGATGVAIVEVFTR